MKVIAKAALIVGAVAAIATGVGAIVGGTAFLAATGVSLATVSAIGTVAGLVGSVAASLSKPKGTTAGSLTDFKLDPAATIPIMFGRTYNGGNVVARDSWGTDSRYQGFAVVYSGCGPIASIEGFYVDRTLVTFNADGSAIGSAFGASGGKGPWMWFKSQLGRTPEPAALQFGVAGFPGWTAAHKLSGYAAGTLVLQFDKNGKKYQGGVPKTGIVGLGVRAWDPRLDSTYPGGNGTCRLADPTTWPSTRNPWILALQFALGWSENGYLVGGIGALARTIIISDYVAAANIADANGWKVSGVRATGDPKWDTLKLLAEAGGGEPLWLGACLSCLISSPKVSVGTITSADLRGPITIVGTQSRRGGRINTGIPNFRSEPHGWEMISASAIPVATYVAEDGGTRTKEIPFQMVADLGQAAQLTAYSIVNGREFGPIEIKLDPRWIGLQPGMAVNLQIPEAGLNGQQAIVIARSIDPGSAMVSITLKSETPAKHAFALGSTAVAPPTPSLVAPDYETAAVNYELAGQSAAYIRNSAPRDVALSAAVVQANQVKSATLTTAPWASISGLIVKDEGNVGPNAERTTSLQAAQTSFSLIYAPLTGTKRLYATVKAVSGDWITLFGDKGGAGQHTWFNLKTGVVGTNNNTSASIEALGNGWYLCSILNTFNGGNVGFTVASGDATNNSVVGQKALFTNVYWSDPATAVAVTIGDHTRDYPDRSIAVTGATLQGLPFSSNVLIYYDDQSRSATAPAYQWTLDYEVAVNSASNPYRHYVGLTPTPAASGAPVQGDPPPYPGGGGYCVDEDAMVLLYDGSEKRAGDLVVGDLVKTRHELTFEVGNWPVQAVDRAWCEEAWQWRTVRGSPAHLVHALDDWHRLDEVGEPAGSCYVAKITVAGAHTLITNGELSHNIKMNQQQQL